MSSLFSCLRFSHKRILSCWVQYILPLTSASKMSCFCFTHWNVGNWGDLLNLSWLVHFTMVSGWLSRSRITQYVLSIIMLRTVSFKFEYLWCYIILIWLYIQIMKSFGLFNFTRISISKPQIPLVDAYAHVEIHGRMHLMVIRWPLNMKVWGKRMIREQQKPASAAAVESDTTSSQLHWVNLS